MRAGWMNCAVRRRVFFGISLIGLGLVLLAAHFDWLDWDDVRFWQYWPVILMAHGLSHLLIPNRSGDRIKGMFEFLVGVWCQACVLHWHEWSFHRTWPVLVILYGLRLMIEGNELAVSEEERHHETV